MVSLHNIPHKAHQDRDPNTMFDKVLVSNCPSSSVGVDQIWQGKLILSHEKMFISLFTPHKYWSDGA